ncbi:MAG: TonB-dependent receptor, partial [Dehalococcoidia bacterium]|nr:TonB-dependent receptor [Dehalococcoidia bacterium]
MRALKPVLAVLCIFSLAFAGQTGKIAGRVTEAGTENPLIGTNVVVDGTSFGAATDVNGEYFIINLPPGVYSVKFSMIGYAEYTATDVSVSIDVTTPLEAALESQAIAGESVTVVSQRPSIEKTLTSTKQYVSGSLTTELPVATVKDVVKTLPGVIEHDGLLHLRGGRSGEEMYLVDGASVINPLMGNSAIPINPAMIEELQVITGTFNAEYGQAMSGIFNTVLKEAPDGVHANVTFRTSGTQDYIRSEGGADGDFKDVDIYSESLEVAEGEGYRSATTSEHTMDQTFGDPMSILDADVSVGSGAFGLVASMRSYNDPGRLPGISEEYSSYQAKLTYQVGGNLKLGAEFLYLDEQGMYDPRFDGNRVGETSGELLVTDWKYALGQYPRSESQTVQFGLSANYVLSANTNITLRVDNLSKTTEDGAKTSGGEFVDFVNVKNVTASTQYSGADGPDHTKVLEDRSVNNAWFGTMNVYGHYFKSKDSHTTFSLAGTSQLNNRH